MTNDWTFPPVPAELKALSPFFQRAQELKTKDAVMAYWCTYYAAKQGISSRAQSKDARPFLYQVMTILEEMKASFGENDAVSDDDAGAAYIDNFAMRVFTMADNEDRKGEATRSTAKKFLASANFFELLNIFDKPVDADITEKIRYAKWKAADIAKAFREGRTPTPGDAQDPDAKPPTLEPPTQESMSAWSPGTSVVPSPARGKDGHTPLPLQIPEHPPSTPPRNGFDGHLTLQPWGELSTPSGMWSTVATPGTEDRTEDVNGEGREVESPSVMAKKRLDGDEEDDAWSTVANQSTSRQGSWTVQVQPPEEGGLGLQPTTEATPEPMPPPAPAPPPVKKVHFSPSVVGGLSSASSSIAATSPPGSPSFEPTLATVQEDIEAVQLRESSPTVPSPTEVVSSQTPAPQPVVPPPHLSVPATSPQFPAAPPQFPAAPPQFPASSPQFPAAPPQFPASSPQFPAAPPQFPATSPPFPAALPQFPATSSQFPTSPSVAPPAPRGFPSAPPTRHRAAPPASPPAELAPMQISNIQKHCKFAISALDYEDVHTARKELLAALEMLGGMR